MRRTFLAAAAFILFAVAAPVRADEYGIDAVHSSVGFKIQHLGISWIQGRFNNMSGTFTLDKDPAKSSFNLTIQADSIDTNNKNRDDHLRSPDFFNVKQIPAMSFKSTAVRMVDGTIEVTGDFTLHGVTKPITFTLKGGRMAEFPKGVQRTGYSTELSIKRSEFGMDKLTDAIGDTVYLAISFEGVKK